MDERGQRYGFEAFDCAPALRLEAHERVARLQHETLVQRLSKIEESIERLEKRLWIAVYGVAAVIVVQGVEHLLSVAP
ncbi:hypothetical protein U5922_004420 [Aquicoccus sp. G2-2]|uniref:GTA head formation protein, RCAP_rcc01685 family n=1 Tax=Aquicoccus sp. G2-2 TaxID=3092120 RepID=UPI002AE0AFE7|nr:hypothetical protein [Aquicoccus sp. G2-2]MEA1112754.1 hypothetical protein [Aquicoccus sp. G2-2]